MQRPGGVKAKFGLWGNADEAASSNYRELNNLVLAVKEEAKLGHLMNAELWLFTDNKVAAQAFHNGTSSSKRLQELVERLRKVEMETGMTLQVVHVAGSRMIAQGTDGLSRGSLMEGVMSGRDMLGYVDLSRTAVERSPGLISLIRDWTGLPKLDPLTTEQWFWEAHGIVGGYKDARQVWILTHAKGSQTYLWSPPPVLADVALEEALKAK